MLPICISYIQDPPRDNICLPQPSHHSAMPFFYFDIVEMTSCQGAGKIEEHTVNCTQSVCDQCRHTLPSSTVLLLFVTFHKTDFSGRAFRCSAPTTCNSLPNTMIAADSMESFKSRLKTQLFNQTLAVSTRLPDGANYRTRSIVSAMRASVRRR